MKRVPSLVAATIVVFVFSLPTQTQASPIVVASGTPQVGLGNNPFAISWSQSDTWTNVSISMTFLNSCAEFVFNFCNGTSAVSGEAYLTNAIGPGTTAANQIAFTTLNTSGIVFPTLFPFSNLTLGPDTYYLIFLQRTPSGFFWAGSGFPYQLTAALGVTPGPAYLGNTSYPLLGYPPASDFFTYPLDSAGAPLFSITGDRASENPAPVPEPTSLLFMGTGLSLITQALRRRRR